MVNPLWIIVDLADLLSVIANLLNNNGKSITNHGGRFIINHGRLTNNGTPWIMLDLADPLNNNKSA